MNKYNQDIAKLAFEVLQEVQEKQIALLKGAVGVRIAFAREARNINWREFLKEENIQVIR